MLYLFVKSSQKELTNPDFLKQRWLDLKITKSCIKVLFKFYIAYSSVPTVVTLACMHQHLETIWGRSFLLRFINVL